MTAALDARVQAALNSIRQPGTGCHGSLQSVANTLILAGYTPAEAFTAIRSHIPAGTRPVPDKEIHDAIRTAQRDCHGFKATRGSYHAPIRRPALDPSKMLRGILAKGEGAQDVDLFELSPVHLGWAPEEDAINLLNLLYMQEDRLFIGGWYDTETEYVRTAADWCKRFATGKPVLPHIIPNPMTGKLGLKKDGGPSFRCDDCIAQFRFAVMEFDTVPPPLLMPGQAKTDAWPRESQCQFWAGALAFNWPIAALVDSGGKSIHCWLTVDAVDVTDWTTKIEGELFARFLVPCGVDSTCKNESRLSRMPGHYRTEKSRWQRIIYLNPDAGKEAS